MDRPAMASLLGYLDKDLTTNYVVIFDDLKRFARDTVFHIKLRQAFNARNARVECLNFTFEDTPEGYFIETVLAAQNELDRKQNQRQVIQKMKARLEKGYWAFVPPFGYRTIKDAIHGKILKKFELEAEIVREAFEGFANGRFENQVDVQKFLESKKIRKHKLTLDVVKRLLTNSLYAGYVEYKEWNVERRIGHHEPLILSDVYEQVQDKLNGKVKVRSRKDSSKEFPLRGFVLCSECLGTMTASWTTGRNKKHPYYHCKNKQCLMKWKSIKRKTIEDEFEAILRSIKPKERTLNLTKEILLDVWNKKISNVDSVRKENENTLDSIRAKMRTYLDRISKTENENLIKTYEAEIQKLTTEEQKLESLVKVVRGSIPDFGTALDLTFSFLKNPYAYWKKDDLKSKHLVLKLVFMDRLTYELGNGFRTANLSLPLRVFEEFTTLNSDNVASYVTQLEPRTSNSGSRNLEKQHRQTLYGSTEGIAMQPNEANSYASPVRLLHSPGLSLALPVWGEYLGFR